MANVPAGFWFIFEIFVKRKGARSSFVIDKQKYSRRGRETGGKYFFLAPYTLAAFELTARNRRRGGKPAGVCVP